MPAEPMEVELLTRWRTHTLNSTQVFAGSRVFYSLGDTAAVYPMLDGSRLP